MTEKIVKSRLFNKLAEVLIPFAAWLIITFPLWLSPFHPAMVAYFIIAFDLYFLYKSAITTYLATYSYRKIAHIGKIDFSKKLVKIKNSPNIKHFIIIPNYKEPLNKITSTITTLTHSVYPYKNLYLVLAFEDREKDVFTKSQLLKNKFSRYFSDVITTFHPLT